MKKTLTLLLCVLMCFSFFACGIDSDAESSGYEIALITDINSVDDKSFNQAIWEGIENYAKKKNDTYKYYQIEEDSDTARNEQIDLAVKNGAKIIFASGSLFEEAVYSAQEKYPDVDFVLIDGNPHDSDGNYKTGKNTLGICFSEEQAGYLAGYAAVKDGYTKLGFIGGIKLEPVERYGYGFVQGAEDAAKEKNITVDIKYNYSGTFSASSEVQETADKWYKDGTEVIFSCGGSIFDSILNAATDNDGKIIGVDVDQSGESNLVITSAMKELGTAVNNALDAFYDGDFPGGNAWVLGASKEAVGLPMDKSKFNNFTKDDYDAVYTKLDDGSVTILTPADVAEVSDLSLIAVTLTVI